MTVKTARPYFQPGEFLDKVEAHTAAMNPTQAPFPSNQPALKLSRRSVTTSPLEGGSTTAPFETMAQRDIASDLAALQEREANLREYEVRLRAWQDELDARAGQPSFGATGAPFPRASSQSPFSESDLAAAWQKFHRARALLEAEQNQMRDERMVMRDTEARLRAREAALAEREAKLKEREMLLTITVGAAEKAAEPTPEPEKPMSTIQRLTQAPWAVFKSGK